jgi:hypothetical protein
LKSTFERVTFAGRFALIPNLPVGRQACFGISKYCLGTKTLNQVQGEESCSKSTKYIIQSKAKAQVPEDLVFLFD